ncbi:MAG: type I glyceraldehyde-3-phosphate dehydrogenase [Gammaproteobacteria bacterium]|nr:MAG: type I glyceraldehyde-3-phosphate dehydrogenase [Gammaproteobacteria bacterium]
MRIGINGFGRIGRLVMRAGWGTPGLEFQQINDPRADNETLAHLLNFDSTYRRWQHTATATDDGIEIDGKLIRATHESVIVETDWSNCDLVIESSGKMRSTALLQGYLDQGVGHVVVSAPVKEPGVLNLVVGVNDHLFDPQQHSIITAASCTTNCLAPVVKVIHEQLGIAHGSMTTIHALTNTQTIIDAPHPDLRRARSASDSLIPTTTGSATAITEVFPDLKGRLNGHAVRVPLTSPSLCDVVFEVKRPTSVDEVNQFLREAAEGSLKGILGFEQQPLVSTDYIGDPRSAIIDGLSSMVIDQTQVKLYAWYDNEWGYANRTIELAALAGGIKIHP